MSATVYNPMIMSEAARLRTPVVRRPAAPSSISAARVKRDLFGPVDKEDSKKFIERELAAHSEVLSRKWGFDFRSGKPLDNHAQYQWERVPPTSAETSTTTPACYGGMITLTRAAHVVAGPQTSTSSELLMDRRAERENAFDSELVTVRTHPLVPISASAAVPLLTRSVSSDSSSSSSSSSSSRSLSSCFPSQTTREKRQQRITDFLKERKRPTSAASKLDLAKKARLMLTAETGASPSSLTLRSSKSSSPRH